jgi:hypothetical protein
MEKLGEARLMSLKVWHSLLGTAVVIALGVIFFADAWNWFFCLVAVWLMLFFGSNLVFAWRNRIRLSDHSLWKLSEYKNHQDFSLAAAREVWDDEKPGSTLELRVKLRGVIEAGETGRAPLSSKEASAWRLTVDGFRHTRLGAEGDFTSLVDKTWVPRLVLADAGDRAAIEPPARLNAGLFREERVTGEGLGSFPHVKALVEEAAAFQGLNRSQFTGFRITETRLEAEPVTVYGTLSRGDGLKLTGTDVPDDPGSLLIVADRAKDKKRLQRQRSPVYWINVALFVLSLPVVTIAVANSPWVPTYEGPVEVTPGGQELQIEIGGSASKVWTFDGKDTRTLVSLQSDGKDSPQSADQMLVLTVFGGTVKDYGPDREGRLKWQNGHWLLDPAQKPALNRTGLFHFRNLTSRKVTLRFPSDSELSTYTWSLKPHEGQGTDSGNYLTLNNKDLPIPEGTEVSLEAGKDERHLVAGVSPELVWNGSLDAWLLTLGDPVLKTGSAPLWAVPDPRLHLRGVVVDAPDGQTDTFDVPPGPPDQPVPVKSVAGEAYSVVDTQVFSLRTTDVKVLFSGPLRGYKGTTWVRDHWELVVPLTPAP